MLLKNYKNAHQPKSSISKNARLSLIYYIYQNKYIINCLQKLCNSKALLLICYFQILSMDLYNICCQNCAYSKILPFGIRSSFCCQPKTANRITAHGASRGQANTLDENTKYLGRHVPRTHSKMVTGGTIWQSPRCISMGLWLTTYSCAPCRSLIT